MEQLGMGEFIPKYKRKEQPSQSLASTHNRCLDNWDFSQIKLDEMSKKKLISYVVQTMVLLLTTTTCYTFGGKLYRQKSGLGIGLRGSAALARLVMCAWDLTWGRKQLKLGLVVQLFARYVDDIRLLLRPLLPGWYWSNGTWIHKDEQDDRTPLDRTVQEVTKSLNDVWSFLKFTSEKESDYADGFLPTLDFSIKVVNSGRIQYKFYRKKMASNLVLQIGTALSNACIFSSLRQDLVRRLVNSSFELGFKYRCDMVEDYIQLMVNSGHKFSFIKSIVLQALTRYTYMISRSELPLENKRYSPLHRLRT